MEISKTIDSVISLKLIKWRNSPIFLSRKIMSFELIGFDKVENR